MVRRQRFETVLEEMGACLPARRWVGRLSVDEAWELCQDAEWMRWLVRRAAPDVTPADWPDAARALWSIAGAEALREVFRDRVAAWARSRNLTIRSRRKVWRLDE